uniref:Uncharacterized protein n=1 Tax=Podoviridae sp. ct8Lf7 TaxID=2827723 RepID=A0A8S5S1P9_9CAUD|nr:MAG TPA: hypothetical protein [Podoviridae sp. ct8Lf7]
MTLYSSTKSSNYCKVSKLYIASQLWNYFI